MKKITSKLLAMLVIFFATKTNAQWNLNGNNNATGTSLLGTTNSVPLRLGTKNISRLIIDTLGRIGVGTSTPTQLFTVQSSGLPPAASWITSGASVFSGYGQTNPGNADLNLLMASSNFANANGSLNMRRSRGTLTKPTVVEANDRLGTVNASGFDGSSFQNTASVDFFTEATKNGITSGNLPTRLTFSTGSNSSNKSERLRIGSTGDFTFNNNQLFIESNTGNVGLGTISPLAKLDVAGKIRIVDGSQGTGKILTSDSNGLATWKSPAASSWKITGTNITNNNSGNVGIGVTTPTAKLDIAGNIKIADGTQGAGKFLTSDANGVASWSNINSSQLINPSQLNDYSCSGEIGSLSNIQTSKGLAVSGNYAYTIASGPGNLNIINIANPAVPVVSGSVNIGLGILDMSVFGNKAYTCQVASKLLSVIDISNATSPVVNGSVAFSDFPLSCTAIGNTVYVVTIDRKFHVVNASNPVSPAIIGTVNIDTSPRKIVLAGNYAYVVNLSNTLQVIDISNPTAPALVSTVLTDGECPDMEIKGNYIYVVNTSSNSIQVFDITNPVNPVLSSTIPTIDYPSEITISNNIAIVSSNITWRNNFYDLSNAPQMVSRGTYMGINIAYDTYLVDDKLYISGYKGFRVVKFGKCAQNLAVDANGNFTTSDVLWKRNGDGMNNVKNANVGIGTENPKSALHIVGRMRYEDGNQAYGKILTSTDEGNAYWSYENDPKVGYLTDNNIPFWSDSANSLRTSMINQNNGIVNIGNSLNKASNVLRVNGEAFINSLYLGRGPGAISSNTVLGFGGTLFSNTTGAENTAIGNAALSYNTTGSSNTGIGNKALYSNTTGNNNTGIGHRALGGNVMGNNNTAIGSMANVSNYLLTNATALGANATVNASNKVRIGNSAVTVVESNAGSWTTSDGRFKTNVKEEVKGLEFIKLLRPVVYNFDSKKFDQFVRKEMPDSIRKLSTEGMEAEMAKATAIRQTGFIAQEVVEAAQKSGYDFNGVHIPENATDNYSISYEKMVVPLVKAVQELSAEVDKLKAMLATNNGKPTENVTEQNISFNEASLSQNSPNPPVNNFTKINYSIPNGAAKAEMVITDNLGRTIKQITLNNFGKGTLNVDTRGLNSGSYSYTLLIDGKVISTKKMLIAK